MTEGSCVSAKQTEPTTASWRVISAAPATAPEAPVSDSRVDFLGPGPYIIAHAQSASASAEEAAVAVTLNASVGDAPEPRSIVIEMTHDVANRLGHDLIVAAIEAESRSLVESSETAATPDE